MSSPMWRPAIATFRKGSHDRNTDRGTPAQGNFQSITPTWQRQAPKAGVDIRQYPTAMSAPPSVQAQVAAVTPLREWGPNTVAAVKAHFPGIDVNQPPSGVYHGSNVGGAVPTTPGTTLSTPPPATAIANALAGGTGADGKGPSPIQQAQQDVGGEGGQALPPALAPQTRNAEYAQPGSRRSRAPQLMAALRQAAAQPLSWSSRPYGSTAGPQTPVTPGTTLNSNSGLYG